MIPIRLLYYLVMEDGIQVAHPNQGRLEDLVDQIRDAAPSALPVDHPMVDQMLLQEEAFETLEEVVVVAVEEEGDPTSRLSAAFGQQKG
jgi:hypothetical protein